MNKPNSITELNATLVAALDALPNEPKPKQIKDFISLLTEAFDLVCKQENQAYEDRENLTFWGRPYGQPLTDEVVWDVFRSEIEAYREFLGSLCKPSKIKYLISTSRPGFPRCRWFNQQLMRITVWATYQPTDGPRIVIHSAGVVIFAPPGKDLILPKEAVENLHKLVTLMAHPETTPVQAAPAAAAA